MSELDDLRAELAELHMIVADMAIVLQEVQQESLAESKWWWSAMTQQEVRRNWPKVVAFADELGRWYGTPTHSEVRPPTWLVPCWYRHPRALDAMTALYVAHTEAYGKRGRGWDKAEWQTRWYRDLGDVVREEAGRCSPQRCGHDGASDPGDVQARQAFAEKLATQLQDGSARPKMRVSGGEEVSPPDLDNL